MPLIMPTNQEAYCYIGASERACAKAQSIVCGYETATEAACAKALGVPAPVACDCVDEE